MSGGPRFVGALRECGYGFFTGVPCSLLKGAFAELEKSPDFIAAVREDTAIGMAAGATLAGRKSVVLMQNSGLGVSLNALASLSMMYEIPALLVVSWRGHGKDAPEHVLTGQITPQLLKAIGAPTLVLELDHLEEQIREADELLNRYRHPVAMLVREGILA